MRIGKSRVLATTVVSLVAAGGVALSVPVPVVAAPALTTADPAAVPAAADAFALHSRPGSDRVVFIDADGADVSGTRWNKRIADGFYPGFSLDADPAFSEAERAAVVEVWQRVSEDFAPFDVDVTTEDPGVAAIDRSGRTDTEYGTRVLISDSEVAKASLCNEGSCGGKAYTGGFDAFGSGEASHAANQPAWVFSASMKGAKSLAEAVSHEAGHTLGLGHDGTADDDYYRGHAMWAPIMGVGYTRPVTQWSQGEYAGASRPDQDDLAVIGAATGAPLLADDVGGDLASASTSIAGRHLITTRDDVDVFRVDSCASPVVATATPAEVGPNLDIRLDLLDSAGTLVASDDPPAAMVDRFQASGLAAGIVSQVTPGTVHLRVDGVGVGSPLDTGYSDYGSLGAYTLTVTCGASVTTPGAPASLTATPGPQGKAVTLGWSAPAADGGAPVTGYRLTRTGAGPVDLGRAGSYQWTGLTPGATYTFTVAALNAAGAGAPATISVTTPGGATVAGAPGIGKAKSGKKGGKKTASIRWSVPASDGGSDLTGWTVQAQKLKKGKVTSTKTFTVSDPDATSYTAKLKRGVYRFVVTALNAVGASAPSAPSKAVKAR